MGWMWTKRSKGETHEEFFVRTGVLRWNVPGVTYRVLKSSTVNNTFYAAVERTEGPKRQVFAVIILIRWDPRAKYRNNFGYKDMDETEGPYEARCPDAILDLLTETGSEYAKAWRERCRRWNEVKARTQRWTGPILLQEALHLQSRDGDIRELEIVCKASRRGYLIARSLGPDLIGQEFQVRKSFLQNRLAQEQL